MDYDQLRIDQFFKKYDINAPRKKVKIDGDEECIRIHERVCE